ncbi:MAG: HAD-superfamily hydrolase, subfamily IA, variant 3 [uncultured bacterium]|nr:MAG: HAD-superfamily hydrolase, subfamily IA, variant 3 [uncultured bacterium]
MGILLALNTATQNTEIAILDGRHILREDSWPAESNESDRILPYLRDTLTELGLSFKDITALFIVKGPGHFTALRIGITIVNTLAYALKIPVYEMDTFEMMKLKAATAKPLIALLEGGGESKFSRKFPSNMSFANAKRLDNIAQVSANASHALDPKIGTLDEHLEEGFLYACDLKKQPAEIKCVNLLSFGEALLSQDFDQLKKTDIVMPLYLRAPNITIKK